jgi:hypothetical protein
MLLGTLSPDNLLCLYFRYSQYTSKFVASISWCSSCAEGSAGLNALLVTTQCHWNYVILFIYTHYFCRMVLQKQVFPLHILFVRWMQDQ